MGKGRGQRYGCGHTHPAQRIRGRHLRTRRDEQADRSQTYRQKRQRNQHLRRQGEIDLT